MARTLISPSTLHLPYNVTPGTLGVPYTNADPVNGNYFVYDNTATVMLLVAAVQPPDTIWHADMTFQAGQVVSWANPTLTFYRCLQTSTGNQPDTSPTYWEVYPGESFTLISTPDPYGRTGDLTYALAMKTNAVLRIVPDGWIQSDSTIQIDPSTSRLYLGLIKL